MIIDAHCHLKHGDAEGTEFPADDVVRAMDATGVHKSVVFAMSTTTRHSVELADQAVGQFPDRLIPYVYALPSYERPVAPELEEAISERGFRGIKIHLGECTLAEYVIDPVMELAGQLGAPCLVDLKGQAGVAESLASRFPQTTLLIAHMGQYLCTDPQLIDRFIDIAERHSNVWLDVSGVATLWKIKEAAVRLGSKRLIWGTDGPVRAPDIASFVQTEMDKVRMLKLGREAEQDILGGSLASLLSL
jgi:hypothetical protein